MNFEEYLRLTYSSWLGKVIGVRLGAPIENWTYEDIKNTYGRITDYPVDYGVFASDDDLNGPLFFVRCLLEDCSEDISVEKMGDVLLNYLRENIGFFWWGGIGVSTEDTAYHNLKKGIKAPLSGAIETNGVTIAEQIGGQIFSDCWGYVAYGNPDRAKKLATKMSSVTHDGDGIQGGIFVAVCIALAYELSDIHEVINKALDYLEDSTYKKCVSDIIEKSKVFSLEECKEYIFENYSYAKYDGVCHIIPNTAIMVMSMLYGDNDFSKTLCILAECGWDTDCTCGNVGSIMGALVGIEGIDAKWIRPINDVILCSSAIGDLNQTTVSESALLFAKIGAQLEGVEVPEKYADGHSYFDLPYATQGLYALNHSSSTISVVQCDDHLNGVLSFIHEGEVGRVNKKTYYLPDDVYDCRYQPDLIPQVYPGNTIKFKLSGKSDAEYAIYAKDIQGNYYESIAFELVDKPKWYSFNLDVNPETVITDIGIKVIAKKWIMHQAFYIHEMYIDGSSDYVIDFVDKEMEDWHKDFGGLAYMTYPGVVSLTHNSQLEDDGIRVTNDTLVFGKLSDKLRRIEIELEVLKGSFNVLWDMKHLNSYKKMEFLENKIEFSEINNSCISKTEQNTGIVNYFTKFLLCLSVKESLIKVEAWGQSLFVRCPNADKGCLGIKVDENSEVLIKKITIHS